MFVTYRVPGESGSWSCIYLNVSRFYRLKLNGTKPQKNIVEMCPLFKSLCITKLLLNDDF